MLSHFPLEPGCEDYFFLDMAVEDFMHGHDSILMESTDITELDASFDEDNGMPSSVSLGFLCLVSTISDNSRMQLASSIKSHE